MSFLQDARDVTVLGGTFVAASPGGTVHYHEGSEQGISNAFKELSSAAALTALHECFATPRCHTNTRDKYLKNLELWMLGKETVYSGKSLIWLRGGAGAGKSAIMQSVVERCSPHNVILGTFFFSRSDPSRDFAEALIPTLAYQVVCAFPAANSVLELVVKRIPHIFKAALHIVVRELLVPLLRHVSQMGEIQKTGTSRRVFVIDGLDECSNPLKHAAIINSVAVILCQYHLPVLFVIASRPELPISTAFLAETQLHDLMEPVTLDDDNDAGADIRQFVQDSFSDIANFHPQRHHIALPWPHPASVERLVLKSSGHFVYAAIAMKFIASSQEHPARALRVIEGLESSRTGSPFAELDALYMHIINSAAHRSNVVAILRHCFLTNFANTVPSVCSIFNSSPEDIDLFLSDVQALVSMSLSTTEGQIVIKPKHASLGDFLQDRERSQDLYMTKEMYHASLLRRYFELFEDGLQSPTPSLSEYCGSDLYSSENILVSAMCEAIAHSERTDVLVTLVSRYSPRDIWKFCLRCYAQDQTSLTVEASGKTCSYSAALYMKTIRDSIADEDGSLYMQYFSTFMQLLFDDLSKRPSRSSQYRIFPALLCTSSRSALPVAYHLTDIFCLSFAPGGTYSQYLDHLLSPPGITDPRTLEALMRLPQRQLSSWGADLTVVMKLVLQMLPAQSWTLTYLNASPHLAWLKRKKPLKQLSMGSPLLSTRYYDRVRRIPKPRISDPSDPVVRILVRRGYNVAYARFLTRKRLRLFILLKAIVYFLDKATYTSEVANLARRSLPKISLWFPKEMKQARNKMDAYVLHWQESLQGLFERVQLLSIDDVD